MRREHGFSVPSWALLTVDKVVYSSMNLTRDLPSRDLSSRDELRSYRIHIKVGTEIVFKWVKIRVWLLPLVDEFLVTDVFSAHRAER
jgi:hypothetical protein